MVTRAKRESNNRWDRDNMTILACKVRRDVAQQAKTAANLAGTTVNAALKQAIDQLITGVPQKPNAGQVSDSVVIRSPELVKAVRSSAEAAGMTPVEWVEDLIQRELFG